MVDGKRPGYEQPCFSSGNRVRNDVMTGFPKLEIDRADRRGGNRCPHLVWPSFLGPEDNRVLLDFIQRHEREFLPATVYRARIGRDEVKPSRRTCLRLRNLGPLQDKFQAILRDAAHVVAEVLGIEERIGATVETEICAYSDGVFFEPHIDTPLSFQSVRVISFVHYAFEAPPGFTGGELRLFGWEKPGSDQRDVCDIQPENDMLVAFPSWLQHEVLPVQVPSRRWMSNRFSVNAWIHRQKLRDP